MAIQYNENGSIKRNRDSEIERARRRFRASSEMDDWERHNGVSYSAPSQNGKRESSDLYGKFKRSQHPAGKSEKNPPSPPPQYKAVSSWTTGDPETQMEADYRAKQGYANIANGEYNRVDVPGGYANVVNGEYNRVDGGRNYNYGTYAGGNTDGGGANVYRPYDNNQVPANANIANREYNREDQAPARTAPSQNGMIKPIPPNERPIAYNNGQQVAALPQNRINISDADYERYKVNPNDYINEDGSIDLSRMAKLANVGAMVANASQNVAPYLGTIPGGAAVGVVAPFVGAAGVAQGASRDKDYRDWLIKQQILSEYLPDVDTSNGEW